jgi:hypothetical protein
MRSCVTGLHVRCVGGSKDGKNEVAYCGENSRVAHGWGLTVTSYEPNAQGCLIAVFEIGGGD